MLIGASNVEVTLIETETYKSGKFKELKLISGQTYFALYPNEVFLLVMANDSRSSGDFTISY